jgi:hypothetical protein
MAAFKVPDFNERAAAAREARASALEKLKNKPAPDPAVVAARIAAQEAREKAIAEKRAAKQAAIEEARAAKAAAEAEAAEQARLAQIAAEEAAREAELKKNSLKETLKAARDAKYAARKARQR